MRKAGSAVVKVSFNHLNLRLTVATSSLGISIRLGLSVRKLRHVPVFHSLHGPRALCMVLFDGGPGPFEGTSPL